jgi:hypothetical protein
MPHIGWLPARVDAESPDLSYAGNCSTAISTRQERGFLLKSEAAWTEP